MRIRSHLIILFIMTISLALPAVYFVSTLLMEQVDSVETTNTNFGFTVLQITPEQLQGIIISGLSILVSVIVFLTFYLYLQKNLIAPLNQVPQSVSHILRGKINYNMELNGSDEVELVGKSFDLLRTSIKKKIELEHELHQSRSELENERLVTIGLIAARLAHDIRNPLSVILSDPLPVPPSAYYPRRRQFSAETLLACLPFGEADYVLGVADLDLYVSGLNFVFGLADPSSGRALITLPRLRQSFYGQPDDQGLFQQRVLKEAVHELGHTYGLSHCRDRRCVMAFSNSLSDTDFKSFTFCRRCSDRI